MSTDQLFAAPNPEFGAFRFDQKVVDVFPDMIKRSVPGYATILAMIQQLAARYAQPNSQCYDLGCSLGASLVAICDGAGKQQNVRAIGVDNSSSMLDRCRDLLAAHPPSLPVELKLADICEVQISEASLCVLNFTMQFVPLEKRQTLIQKIYAGMKPGALLILSEKIRFEDAAHDALMNELHHNFKRLNGYSALEISQKRDSLENVLIPETFASHQQRLLSAGFERIEMWFQCFNFMSLLAFKPL